LLLDAILVDSGIISRETGDPLPARVCDGDSEADHVNTASEHLRVCELCSGNHQETHAPKRAHRRCKLHVLPPCLDVAVAAYGAMTLALFQGSSISPGGDFRIS
jgi:hypothetical protein